MRPPEFQYRIATKTILAWAASAIVGWTIVIAAIALVIKLS